MNFIGEWFLRCGIRATVTKQDGSLWLGKIHMANSITPIPSYWNITGDSDLGKEYDLYERDRGRLFFSNMLTSLQQIEKETKNAKTAT